MSHQVIPRKYRPQTFDQLVGQDAITKCFLSMIQRNVIPHALLMCGTRGVGKTSTARIFSKALLCPSRTEDGNPCSTCDSCKQVETGHHLDVLEIDGASNNGVEAIRELRETAHYLPSGGKHKIYIIDEVHMLSNSAFNALLKILEEPPPHLIFVFATTDPGQLPATILSRVMRFDFHPIKTPMLAKHLTFIAKNESRKISNAAINKIAAMGDGSMRDAEMLLEQVFAFFEPEHAVEVSDLETLFSLVGQDRICSLVEHIGQEDANGCMQLLAQMLSEGYDPYTIGLELQRFLRYVLLAVEAPNMLKLELEHSPELIKRLQTMRTLPGFTADCLLIMFQCLLKSLQTMRYADHPQWVLEACLLQLSKVRLWFHLGESMPTATNTAPHPVRPNPTPQPLQSEPSAKPRELSTPHAPAPSNTTPTQPPESSSSSETQTFFQTIQAKDPVLYGLVKSCHVHILGQQVTIAKGRNAFTFDQLKDSRNKKRFLEACKDSSFADKQIIFKDDAEGTTQMSSPSSALVPDLKERKQRLINSPTVKTLKAQLGAEITKVVEDKSVLDLEDTTK